ncbi:MAG TPA: hypothetical protein VIE68_09305 [Gemmatimonadota bacterium]|jgi:hypothetical protein
MKSALRFLIVSLVFLAVGFSRASAQDEHVVSLYRIAPGQHIAFLQFMADGEAAALDAGVPASQWYVHHNGDQWDFLSIAPDLTDEQAEAVDAASRARGLKTGGQGAIEFRMYVAWHTDTFVGGPMTAAELLANAQSD